MRLVVTCFSMILILFFYPSAYFCVTFKLTLTPLLYIWAIFVRVFLFKQSGIRFVLCQFCKSNDFFVHFMISFCHWNKIISNFLFHASLIPFLYGWVCLVSFIFFGCCRLEQVIELFLLKLGNYIVHFGFGGLTMQSIIHLWRYYVWDVVVALSFATAT